VCRVCRVVSCRVSCGVVWCRVVSCAAGLTPCGGAVRVGASPQIGVTWVDHLADADPSSAGSGDGAPTDSGAAVQYVHTFLAAGLITISPVSCVSCVCRVCVVCVSCVCRVCVVCVSCVSCVSCARAVCAVGRYGLATNTYSFGVSASSHTYSQGGWRGLIHDALLPDLRYDLALIVCPPFPSLPLP
jgi:hypothetical protein